MTLVNLRYAIVDLESGKVEEHSLPDDYVSSGSRMFEHVDSVLRDRGDAFAIGSGLATASFIPAACGGFVRLPGDAPPHERTCLLTGGLGVELKLTGFDFVVLEKAAPEPGYLWVRDGIAEFVPSSEMANTDSWGRTDAVRAEQGDRKIQVLTVGPWGDDASHHSQLIINYWAGEDKRGFAAEFGKRNLLATAFRGMGEIELDDPEGHFLASKGLQAKHISSLGRSGGLASFSDAATRQDFIDLRHRDVACFGCPFPCRTFYKTAEDPRTMGLGGKEPGYLVYDVQAVERLTALGMSAREIVSFLMACARSGAEPLFVVDSVRSRGQEVSENSVAMVLAERDAPGPVDLLDPGAFSGPSVDTEFLMTCLALGLCPRYWSVAGLDPGLVSKALELASGMSAGL